MDNAALKPTPAPVVPSNARGSFVMVTMLFALWGFANDITNPLVRAFKDVFPHLTNAQSSLIQFAFYGGYATMAIPAALFIRQYSYKAGILLGLALYAAGYTVLAVHSAQHRLCELYHELCQPCLSQIDSTVLPSRALIIQMVPVFPPVITADLQCDLLGCGVLLTETLTLWTLCCTCAAGYGNTNRFLLRVILQRTTVPAGCMSMRSKSMAEIVLHRPSAGTHTKKEING